MTSGHVLFPEQLSTVFHFLFSFVLSFSLFLGTSQLWMGWQHSCSSSFHSFKTCWLVTMAVFSLSQLSAFVELWHVSIVMYFLRLYFKLSHLNLFPFTLPVSLLITEWVDCPVFWSHWTELWWLTAVCIIFFRSGAFQRSSACVKTFWSLWVRSHQEWTRSFVTPRCDLKWRGMEQGLEGYRDPIINSKLLCQRGNLSSGQCN